MPQALRQSLLSLRDLALTVGPFVLLAASGCGGAWGRAEGQNQAP